VEPNQYKKYESLLVNKFEHFMFNNSFSKNRAVCEILWKKDSRAGLATDDSMAHAHRMLDN
jgi:hypothetical protein